MAAAAVGHEEHALVAVGGGELSCSTTRSLGSSLGQIGGDRGGSCRPRGASAGRGGRDLELAGDLGPAGAVERLAEVAFRAGLGGDRGARRWHWSLGSPPRCRDGGRRRHPRRERQLAAWYRNAKLGQSGRAGFGRVITCTTTCP